MKENETIEGNKLIAEFMGGKCEYDAPIGWIKDVKGLPEWLSRRDRFYLEQGQYHTSWDWLMPVWKKWNTAAVHLQLKKPELRRDYLEYKILISHAILTGDIETAQKLLAGAIEWYKTQTPKPQGGIARWVKVSERKPDKTGMYIYKTEGGV